MIYQNTITSKNGYTDDISYHFEANTSLAFIETYLVYVKNNKCSISITLINSETWVVEGTMNFPQNSTQDIVDIKLIGLHKYLSAMVIVNRKMDFANSGDGRPMFVNYF